MSAHTPYRVDYATPPRVARFSNREDADTFAQLMSRDHAVADVTTRTGTLLKRWRDGAPA